MVLDCSMNYELKMLNAQNRESVCLSGEHIHRKICVPSIRTSDGVFERSINLCYNRRVKSIFVLHCDILQCTADNGAKSKSNLSNRLYAFVTQKHIIS